MATITVTIPAGAVTRVLNAFGSAYGYKATIPDPANHGQTIPNPQTLAVFAQLRVKDFIQDLVRSQEAVSAAETARAVAIANSDVGLS